MFDAWFDVELCASAYDLDPAEPLTQAEVDSLDLAEALEVCAGCGIEVDPEHARFALAPARWPNPRGSTHGKRSCTSTVN